MTGGMPASGAAQYPAVPIPCPPSPQTFLHHLHPSTPPAHLRGSPHRISPPHNPTAPPSPQMGRTPLLLAAEKSCESDMFRVLLRHGADPSAADPAGVTVLTLVREKARQFQGKEDPDRLGNTDDPESGGGPENERVAQIRRE